MMAMWKNKPLGSKTFATKRLSRDPDSTTVSVELTRITSPDGGLAFSELCIGSAEPPVVRVDDTCDCVAQLYDMYVVVNDAAACRPEQRSNSAAVSKKRSKKDKPPSPPNEIVPASTAVPRQFNSIIPQLRQFKSKCYHFGSGSNMNLWQGQGDVIDALVTPSSGSVVECVGGGTYIAFATTANHTSPSTMRLYGHGLSSGRLSSGESDPRAFIVMEPGAINLSTVAENKVTEIYYLANGILSQSAVQSGISHRNPRQGRTAMAGEIRYTPDGSIIALGPLLYAAGRTTIRENSVAIVLSTAVVVGDVATGMFSRKPDNPEVLVIDYTKIVPKHLEADLFTGRPSSGSLVMTEADQNWATDTLVRWFQRPVINDGTTIDFFGTGKSSRAQVVGTGRRRTSSKELSAGAAVELKFTPIKSKTVKAARPKSCTSTSSESGREHGHDDSADRPSKFPRLLPPAATVSAASHLNNISVNVSTDGFASAFQRSLDQVAANSDIHNSTLLELAKLQGEIQGAKEVRELAERAASAEGRVQGLHQALVLQKEHAQETKAQNVAHQAAVQQATKMSMAHVALFSGNIAVMNSLLGTPSAQPTSFSPL